jgi:hypothetical protein
MHASNQQPPTESSHQHSHGVLTTNTHSCDAQQRRHAQTAMLCVRKKKCRFVQGNRGIIFLDMP